MAYLRVINRPIYFSIISIISVSVTILANIFLVTKLSMGIVGVVYGTMAGSLVRILLVAPLLISGLNFNLFQFDLYKPPLLKTHKT